MSSRHQPHLLPLKSLECWGHEHERYFPNSYDYLDVRVAAALALCRLGPVARPATSKLDELVNEENVLLRETVRDALAAIRKE